MSENIDEKQLYEVVKSVYDSGFNYHTLITPGGLVLEGKQDMQQFLVHYKIPEDLHGKTVLDIGPANGYFSFEMEKRGADVTAIDSLGVFWTDELKKLMNSKVNFKIQDIATLDESFGQFDIVFCSNMLEHHPDIYGNIARIRKVTKGMAIICTEIIKNPAFKDYPLVFFTDNTKHTQGKTAGTYFKPNIKCFTQMAQAAGFSKVDVVSTFDLVPTFKPAKSPEAVLHCYI